MEYVECKIDIDRKNQTLKVMQSVLLQSYEDDFPNAVPMMPATPGAVLTKGDVEPMTGKNQSKYRLQVGVGKLLHMMRWSKPSIYNVTRECSRQMQVGSDE